jgi:Fanconi anemia group M protein
MYKPVYLLFRNFLYAGVMQPAERSRAWKEKRVFFLTPQVMVNDLSRGICPAVAVKCLVIDEAHKALGNHAYCQVAFELC